MAKQLFKSSEKSNFILNLTEEKYSKIASLGLIAACFAVSAATAVPVLMENKMYSISAAGLSIAGVICMITAFIGAIKKYISKKQLMPLCAMGVFLLWSVISLINSYDKEVGFYGFPGRGEGLLATIFYICIFVTAISVKREQTLKTLIYGIIGNGLLNSIFAFVQIFTGKFSEYRNAAIKIEINAASGFSQSPIFLAMVLSISIGAAIIGSLLLKGKGNKIFCIVSAAVFSFVNMFTYSLVGIVGTVLAIIVGAAAVFILKAPKKNLFSLFSVAVPAAAAVLIVQLGAVGNISEYKLYDGRILWTMDSYGRVNSSGNYDADLVDIDDIQDVYYTINRKTVDIINAHGLTGTGPEQLLYPQLYTYGPVGSAESAIEDVAIMNKGTFDKTYNEYLYTAATRGIPSALALSAAFIGIIFIGLVNFKKHRNGYSLCMTLLSGMGVLLYLISCGNTAFSPIFWVIAGLSCADIKN